MFAMLVAMAPFFLVLPEPLPLDEEFDELPEAVNVYHENKEFVVKRQNIQVSGRGFVVLSFVSR